MVWLWWPSKIRILLIFVFVLLFIQGVVHRDVKMENLLFLRPYHPSQQGDVRVSFSYFHSEKNEFLFILFYLFYFILFFF